jgi:tRNA (guanine-N7-)-methyltransferase
VGKDKLRRFRENETFDCLVQPAFDEVFGAEHPLKGRWREDFFRNDRPLCLELGCGRGEYTVALGRRNPAVNYLGVDIKGARMWRGAKTATEYGLSNVGFLRTRIEFIGALFAPDEVDEIWITFPDPQLKKGREKKRLTSPLFLARYARMLKPDGVIHLKTDSQELHRYTRAVIAANGLPLEAADADIYGAGPADETLSVKTAYEERFLAEGLPITYLRFRLAGRHEFAAPEIE